ncbi:MAG: YhdP family protein [Burkholderiales bacterium]|nr:YhdP family protein [Burkholderiales bacterium]
MRILIKRFFLALEVLAWTAFFAFALLVLSLRYWVLPNIERWREDIVAELSRAIGLPVRIGAIETDWAGLRPRVSISDVRIYDRDGREALVLPEVENVVSWRTLAARELRLASVVIEGPRLAIRRDANGAITVGGIEIAGTEGGGRLSDWLLAQDEIVIRDAEVVWTDELRGAPPLALEALNFRMRNDGERHAIGLSARPPRHLAPGLELRAELFGTRLEDLAAWNGRVYAELGQTDLAGWRAWVDYPLEVRSGTGALRVWLTLAAGRLARATADVALANVAARLGPELPLLSVASVEGRLQARAAGHGYEFGVRNLALSAPNLPPMTATSARLLWAPAEGAKPQHGTFSASLVELAPLAHLAEYLPLPADLRRMLAELAPQGRLLDARLEWTGEFPAPAAYSARVRFADLASRAWGKLPGFAGLTGSLEANEKRGTLYLAAQKAAIELPQVFPEPRLRLDSLAGEIVWEREPGGALAVRLANLNFANADLAGSAYGSWRSAPSGPGVVDLSAMLSRADGRATARYLPLGSIMGAQTRRWLETSVVAGTVKEARLRLKGDLRDFPFADSARGQFQVAARISGGVLDYAEGWPRLEALEAELLFERDRMEIVARSGTMLGARLAGVRASIPSLLAAETHLIVDGQAEGATAEFLRFLQTGPARHLAEWLPEGLGASGRGRLRLRLDLPLEHLERTRVAGEYQFAANTIALGERLPPLAAASGRLSFTESSFTLQEVRATLLGGPVTISGGGRAGAPTTIVARGRASVEAIAPLFEHPWRRRLAGAADYTATATMTEGRFRFVLESPLQGIASALPVPLAKRAIDVLPLRVELIPGEGRERVSLALGPPSGRVVAAEFLRTADSRGAMQTQRALVLLNPAAGVETRLPERRGLTVRGSLPALDLDRWLPLFEEGSGASDGGASFDLRVGILDAFGKRLREVALQGATEATGWSASVAAAELSGDLLYRAEGGGRLIARLKHFVVPEDAPGAKPGDAQKTLPALDIVVENFAHRGRKLGRLEVAARHEGATWRIERLAVVNAEASLAAKGVWQTEGGSRTALEFALDVSDLGALLERVGYPEQVKGGRGRLQGRLEWRGDPVLLDYATLAGRLRMDVEDGQFLEIEPGVGKLVALMSLQMLPRRIALDFRDVFAKGFKFDTIGATFAVERGVMTTQDFRMAGPAAQVTISGLVDLNLEAQNLQVRVVPRMDGVASTVVGLINPVAGVATMLAQKILKDPLGQIAAFEYRVTGTWADPKVEQVRAPEPPSANVDDPTRPSAGGH